MLYRLLSTSSWRRSEPLVVLTYLEIAGECGRHMLVCIVVFVGISFVRMPTSLDPTNFVIDSGTSPCIVLPISLGCPTLQPTAPGFRQMASRRRYAADLVVSLSRISHASTMKHLCE
ncbi:unnamed protein product [Scytosiphon promiscuus]